MYKGNLSQLGDASTSTDFSIGGHAAGATANLVTAGTYGEVKATGQYLNGQISEDQYSQQMFTGGAFQAGGGLLVKGLSPEAVPTPAEAVPSPTEPLQANVQPAAPVAGSPNAISIYVAERSSFWQQLDPVDINLKNNTEGPTDFANVSTSFDSGGATPVVNDAPLAASRVFGGNAGMLGRSLSTDSFTNSADATNSLALNPAWGNTAEFAAPAMIRPGTLTFQGRAGPQPAALGVLPGKAQQIFVPYNQLPKVSFGSPVPLPATAATPPPGIP